MTAQLRGIIVDDDPFFAELASISLEGLQIEVERCATGADALASLARPAPDVVLLDLSLPDISGLEVLRHFRNAPAWNETPIVMLTASRDDHDLHEARQRKATGYLCKPVGIEKLRSTIAAVLGEESLLWVDDVTRSYSAPSSHTGAFG